MDHLRAGEPALAQLLDERLVLGHPSVVGEVSLGSLRNRDDVLGLLRVLPPAQVAADPEIAAMIDRRALVGRGIGWVDAVLLAATALTPGARLWTRDRRLAGTARDLDLLARSPA